MSLLSDKKVTVVSTQTIVAPTVIVAEPPQIPARLNIATAVYDYSLNGGALGLYQLPLSKIILKESIIGNIYLNEIVPVTSVGNNLEFDLGLNTPEDIYIDKTFNGSPDSSTVDLLADSVLLTVQFTIKEEPATAGLVQFLITYS